MLEPSTNALVIIYVNLHHLCTPTLYGLLRLTRLSAAIGPASPEGAKDYRRGYHPGIRCPIHGSPERAKDLSCLQHSFYWLQYKRGLSSPPVFSPAFQASARSIRIFHLLLITQVSHLLNLMDIKGFLGILRDIWGRYLCQNGIGPKRHTSL